MMEDYTELLQIAGNATAGPWSLELISTCWYDDEEGDGETIEWGLCESDPTNVDYPWCDPHLGGFIGGTYPLPTRPLDDLRFIAAANPAVIISLINEHQELLKQTENLSTALEYIAHPTMGYTAPPHPPEEFARDFATDANVRLAICTCIRIATEALKANNHHTPVFEALARTIKERDSLKEENLRLRSRLSDEEVRDVLTPYRQDRT